MTREEATKLIEQRGLTVWAHIKTGGKHIMQCMELQSGINVMIDYESDSFSLEYMIPHSIFRITSGDMSPFSSDDHYTKMITKLRSITANYLN